MSYLTWLLVMGLCGWIAGKIVGGKGLGVIADILLGITGALAVRFVLDALRVTVQDADAVLFAIWGAAGLAGLVRFLMKRREGLLSAGASRNAALSRTPDAASYVSGQNTNDTSKVA